MLGQSLQRAREARGLSREELTSRLHMGVEQLKALEQGDGAGLPEPVFVVAQARRVAARLDLNIDAEIAALRASPVFRSPAAPVHAERPPAAAAPPTGAVSVAWRPWLIAAGAGALAVSGFWALQQGWGGGRHQPQVPARLPAPAAGSAPVPGRPPATSPPAQLVLQASEPSWLEVRRADGSVLFRGSFNGERRFPLTGELQVLAGRPDLVRVLESGRPARALGPIESVAWTRFSAPVSPAPPSVPAP
jgi:cytoskeleton protein RodZ